MHAIVEFRNGSTEIEEAAGKKNEGVLIREKNEGREEGRKSPS